METYNAYMTPIKMVYQLIKKVNKDLFNAKLFNQTIGSLRYICNTIPHICQKVGLASIFNEQPKNHTKKFLK